MRETTDIKPNSIDEYVLWATQKFELDFNNNAINYYRIVTNGMREQFIISEFWQCLATRIKKGEEQYLRSTKYELLQNNFIAEVFKKDYDSFLDKCYRKNVLLNGNWPNEPENGWIHHINCYEIIGDLVRTNFVVSYLDGIDFIVNILKETCDECKCKYQISYEARDEGYYAAHFDVLDNFEIPTLNWRTKKIIGRIEIQITTQLKEVIKKLIHKMYKEKRIIVKYKEDKWQWNYKSNEFITNYLGHIIHYIEGTIMELRDGRQTK